MKVFLIYGVLTFLASALHTASAIGRICVNADNQIKKLYIDGQDYTSLLPNRGSVKQCDCITVPPNSGVIALEAFNKKGRAGIQECNTAKPALYAQWHCRPINLARASNWYMPDFDDSKWRKAASYKCKKSHCRKYYKLPCQMSASPCYRSNRPARTIRCRIKQCADDCYGCQSGGYGSCDADKCIYQSGTNELTGKTLCNRRCRLDVKAWPKSGEPADGYIKVTDMLTNSVDTWTANTAGDYFATIDMNTCLITNKNFAPWATADTIITLYNQWNSASFGADKKDVIGVEVGVGDDPTLGQFGSYAPWIAISALGRDNPNSLYADRYRRFSAVLTGVQNGNVTLTDVTIAT